VTEISHLVTRTSSAEPQRARSVAVDTDAGVIASPADDVTPTGKKTNDNNTVCKYGVYAQTDADLARCSCFCASVYGIIKNNNNSNNFDVYVCIFWGDFYRNVAETVSYQSNNQHRLYSVNITWCHFFEAAEDIIIKRTAALLIEIAEIPDERTRFASDGL